MRPILHHHQFICLGVALTKKQTPGLNKNGVCVWGGKRSRQAKCWWTAKKGNL